ncbi:MAG: MFS transporter, partial [Spirochaetota bacterium]|nr:MFS transporter [Spirochaetota bacterium]
MSADTDRFVRFSYFGHGINEIYWFILPLLLPKILNEFGLSYLKAGGLLTVYSVMVSLFSFLIGKASDLLPRLKILIAGFLLTFTGFLLAGLSSSLVILTVCVSAGAIGVSAFHPIAYALLDEHTLEAKGRVFGNFECWGMTGAFIMFAVNGVLLSFFSWRTVLILTAFPSLFMVYLAVISAV